MSLQTTAAAKTFPFQIKLKEALFVVLLNANFVQIAGSNFVFVSRWIFEWENSGLFADGKMLHIHCVISFYLHLILVGSDAFSLENLICWIELNAFMWKFCLGKF